MIEVYGGYTHNTLLTERPSNDDHFIPGGGFSIGGQIDVTDVGAAKLLSGVSIIQKNYAWHRSGAYAAVSQSHTNLYLQLPLSLQLRILNIKRLEIHARAGLFGGYWISRKVEGSIPNVFDTGFSNTDNGKVVQYFYLSSYTLKNHFDDDADNRFELGVQGGIQFRYAIAAPVLPVLNLNYYHSLTPIEKDGVIQNTRVNATMSVTLGILCKID
jgi:hypothetical protein